MHRRRARLGPPLRPHEDAIAGYKAILADHGRRMLLLGVTPGLADVAAEVIAVDRNEAMIANVWPGDTPRRRAMQGDWLALPFPSGYFSSAAGDGSLNSITYPETYAGLLGQLARVIEPGGLFVTRVFMAPERSESVADVVELGRKGDIPVFNAFKWRLAMAQVAEAGNPNIAVTAIRGAFDRAYPDRAALAASSGWDPEDIETIDAYANSSDVYSFPTLSQLRTAVPSSFPDVQIVNAGTYALAERCPLVVMRRGT
jgi:SAM-dependent methyltransferase